MLDRFVSQRQEEWERLERLVALSKTRQIGALSSEEILEMGYLYRRASADLSVARRDFPNDRLALYLNQLVARAHAVVYRSEAGEWRGVKAFFRYGFPALFRETLSFTGAAFVIFLLAALAGFSAVLLAPDSIPYLVPADIVATVKENRMWTEGLQPPSQLLASLIMTNNIRVTLMALAGGVTFGVVTLYAMIANGLHIGSIAGICQTYGLSLRLWSFVAPHGFIELTVIFVAGGAGLRLGHSLLLPGLQSRRESLVLASRKVMRLLFGCVPLLVIAGTIEGFISPSTLLPEAKIAIGIVTAILLYSYLFLSGRKTGRRVG